MAEKKDDEKEKGTPSSHAPMDPKKKKILIGAGAFGVLVLGYLWYRNQSSSSSTTPTSSNPNTSGLVSYVSPTGGSGSGSTPVTINNTNTNAAAGGAGGGVTMGGGVTGPQLPITSVPNKGGKTHLHKVVKKHGVKISGGIHKKSGTTATHHTITVRGHNQRALTPKQQAVVNRHFNHVARPSHSFTTGTAPHNIAIRPPHHAAPRHYGHPGYTHF